MKAVSIIIGIVVLLLWFASASYIAAPASVQKMLPQPPMGTVPHAFLGVVIFLLSIVLIAIWATFTKDAPEIATTA